MRGTAVVIAASLLWAPCGLAQETTGSIMGTITSEDGAPLPGVTVEVEDPARGLRRVALSGRTGAFTVAALPPAGYRLTASLQGFRTLTRPVRVELGRAANVPIEMRVGAFTDEIEVTGEAPILDPTSTVAGFTVNSDDLLSRLPIGREVTQIALLAPGTYPATTWWQLPDATEADGYTPGQGFISFSGSSIGENSYLVNGLNTTNFRNMMGSSFVPMEFVGEVQVKTGGYEAEFGRYTGGVINMVTKSGTNAFRGSFSAYWEPDGLQEQPPGSSWDDTQQRHENLELNASLGGPIMKDRLFFFAFVRYNDSWSAYSSADTAELDEISAPYWGAKLDWDVVSGHRLEGTYLSDEVDVRFTMYDRDPETGTRLDPWGAGVRRRGGGNAVVKYSGLLTPNLLLSAQAGRNDFDRTTVSDGDECPYAWDDRGDDSVRLGCWVAHPIGANSDTRKAYRADLDWFVGRHGLRAGADYELNVASSRLSYSGGIRYRYGLNGAPDQDPEEYRFPDLPWNQNLVWERVYLNGGEFEVNSSAAYVQDSWSVAPSLTLNLGVRWEGYENKNGLGGTFVETDDQFAPRLGVVWDLSGEGRSKLYASFGTYHLPVAATTNIHFAGALYETESWYAFDGNVAADGSPVALGERLEHYVFADGEVPDPRENVSDNFEPMAQNELTVGYERLLGGDWTVGVRGVARWYEQVIEDYTILQAMWTTYGVPCLNPDLLGTDDYCWQNRFRLGNPGRDFDGWYDVDGDDELDRVHIPAEALGYPEAERTYYALELTFAHRFTDRWMLNGSYTWSHLYGNYEGTISEEWGIDAAGINQSFDYPYMMEHGSGDLPGDLRHNVKLYGVYAFDFGLQVGGNLYFHTGRPRNSYGSHPSDPWAAATGYPSFYTGGEPRPRGCCGRTDDIWGLDLLLRYDFRALGADCNVRLDAFNVSNRHGADWLVNMAEWPWGDPVEEYGEPDVYQSPRSVRLGFGVSF